MGWDFGILCISIAIIGHETNHQSSIKIHWESYRIDKKKSQWTIMFCLREWKANRKRVYTLHAWSAVESTLHRMHFNKNDGHECDSRPSLLAISVSVVAFQRTMIEHFLPHRFAPFKTASDIGKINKVGSLIFSPWLSNQKIAVHIWILFNGWWDWWHIGSNGENSARLSVLVQSQRKCSSE